MPPSPYPGSPSATSTRPMGTLPPQSMPPSPYDTKGGGGPVGGPLPPTTMPPTVGFGGKYIPPGVQPPTTPKPAYQPDPTPMQQGMVDYGYGYGNAGNGLQWGFLPPTANPPRGPHLRHPRYPYPDYGFGR